MLVYYIPSYLTLNVKGNVIVTLLKSLLDTQNIFVGAVYRNKFASKSEPSEFLTSYVNGGQVITLSEDVTLLSSTDS